MLGPTLGLVQKASFPAGQEETFVRCVAKTLRRQVHSASGHSTAQSQRRIDGLSGHFAGYRSTADEQRRADIVVAYTALL